MSEEGSLVAEQSTFTDFDLTVISVIAKQLKEHVDLDKKEHKQVTIVREYYLFDGEDARIDVDDAELDRFVEFVLKRDKYRYRIADGYVFVALNDAINLDEVVILFQKSHKSGVFLRWLSCGVFWVGLILGIFCYFTLSLRYSQWFMLLALFFILAGIAIGFCLRNGFIRFKAINDYWKFNDMIKAPKTPKKSKKITHNFY